jgi:K+-sensing histidine kinase KdpD
LVCFTFKEVNQLITDQIHRMEEKDFRATDSGSLKLLSRRREGTAEYQQIISSISHELRTPVAILKSNIQFLKEFSSDMDQEIKDESISMCEESIENVVSFLDNIQLVNSTAKGQILGSYSFFKLKQLIQKVYVDLEKQNLDYKRIAVEWDMAYSEIYSDPALLRQILTNVCSNALKFSNGEVKLRMKTSSQEFTINIQDSGIGIPEEETELVFNPFYRASNALRIPGYGLGLAIVSSLTDFLDGLIYMSSIVRQGTDIKIIIPCETSPSNSDRELF